MDLNCKLKTLYDHENLFCIESIIIVNRIKVFKFNSLTNPAFHFLFQELFALIY
jgi:hypothetical protein